MKEVSHFYFLPCALIARPLSIGLCCILLPPSGVTVCVASNHHAQARLVVRDVTRTPPPIRNAVPVPSSS